MNGVFIMLCHIGMTVIQIILVLMRRSSIKQLDLLEKRIAWKPQTDAVFTV